MFVHVGSTILYIQCIYVIHMYGKRTYSLYMHTYVAIKCVYWGKGPSVDIHAVCMELSFSHLTHGSFMIL